MTRRVEAAPTFERDLKRLARRYRRIRQDVEPLITQLVAGDTPGDRVSNLKAVVYKVRLPNSDARRGKSGGYRVLYYLRSAELVTLLTIYSKSDQANVPDADIERIIKDELGA